MLDHILVPLDGSSLAECVLPHAVAIARAFNARITLLRVLESGRPADPDSVIDPLAWHIRKAEVTTYLDKVVARLFRIGLPVEGHLLEGQAAERIVEFARENNASLIILSSHGKSGLSGWNISSVVQKIILWACMPTMIVRAYRPVADDLADLTYGQVMVPLDGSQRAECALPLASTLARFHHSQLILAHAVCAPEMPRRAPLSREDRELAERITERNRFEAAHYLTQFQSSLAMEVETHLLVGDCATRALHDLVTQSDVDLVVLSAHGYSGGTRWPYGSVALNFIAYGATPLLIVQDLSGDELERTYAQVATREYKGH